MKQFTGSDWLESQISTLTKQIGQIDYELAQGQSGNWKVRGGRVFIILGIIGAIAGIALLGVGAYLMLAVFLPVSAIGAFFGQPMGFSISDETTRLPFVPESAQVIAWSVLGLIGWLIFYALPAISAYRLFHRRKEWKAREGQLAAERAKLDKKLTAMSTGKEGEDVLSSILAEFLNDDWTLYRNVSLELMDGSKADIDAVLVGERGVFVIEIKAYSTEHRLTGDLWERRSGNGWKVETYNPAIQLLSNTARLADYFKLCNVHLPVFPRLAWVGSGRFTIQNQPRVLAWYPNRVDFIQSDIERRAAHDQRQVQNAHNALRNRMIKQSKQTKSIDDML